MHRSSFAPRVRRGLVERLQHPEIFVRWCAGSARNVPWLAASRCQKGRRGRDVCQPGSKGRTQFRRGDGGSDGRVRQHPRLSKSHARALGLSRVFPVSGTRAGSSPTKSVINQFRALLLPSITDRTDTLRFPEASSVWSRPVVRGNLSEWTRS
jgi:hypothetical protein